jgi:uncharacterized protein YkwD
MQAVKTAAFWQILAVLFLLAAVVHVPGQNIAAKNDKPQAILFARWSENQPAPNRSISDLRSSSAAPNSTKFNVAPNALEREAFDSINAARRKANLPPLVFDAEMLFLARQHSELMANSANFTHRGARGEMVDERARNVGIADWRGIGENIAANKDSKNPVATAIECWLNSEGHRRNLLSSDWTRSGIGVALSSDGKYYFTQVFRD